MLAAGQEWCLTCGTAAPGRLRRRAGARAVLATVGLTLALTGGAVAASYAALSKDPVRRGDIALVVPAPPAPTPPPPPVAPPVAEEGTRTAAKTPTPRPKSTATVRDVAQRPATSTNAARDDAQQSSEPRLLDVASSSGALYDPLGRAQFVDGDPHDPKAVLDDDRQTSWAVTAGGLDALQVGYVVDLEQPTSLRYLELVTDTPGLRVEIYGADADVLPPQVTDSRWAKLKARDAVDLNEKEGNESGDGKEKITISDGAQKYRFLLVWATTPAPVQPPDPPSRTLRLFDLKIYGTPS